MNVLIIGSGGREHAMAWKAAQDSAVSKVFVAPGNAGTAQEPNVENVAVKVSDIEGLVAFAQREQIDLTIVGPEVPLVLGVVDAFEAAGLTIFGPQKAAAQLEGSKAFAKDFLARHNIPTASYQNFTDAGLAKAYVEAQGTPIVIKADGLAAGKGVILAFSEQQAFDVIDDMLAGNVFGEAGSRVVIEEFLVGEEASFIVMVDGKHITALATSQDHKARDNGDQGPNTGGMGAYSPAPVVTPAIHDKVMAEVIRPTVDGLAKEGITYKGFLYAGLMISATGEVKVLEFNCRFGDPETQPILMRLASPFAQLCLAGATGQLNTFDVEWDPRSALGVVMAAGGYPGSYPQGDMIDGVDAVTEAKVFHSGTALQDGQLVTAGGRVLCVTALGDDLAAAQQRAYHAVSKIHWKDVYYRTDIGFKAL